MVVEANDALLSEAVERLNINPWSFYPTSLPFVSLDCSSLACYLYFASLGLYITSARLSAAASSALRIWWA